MTANHLAKWHADFLDTYITARCRTSKKKIKKIMPGKQTKVNPQASQST